MSILGWAILAVALAVVEILTTTFFPIFFAISAMVALGISVADGPEWAQWAAFGAVGLALSGFLRPIAQRQFEKGPSLKSRVEELPGRIAIVTTLIDGASLTGAVSIDGQTWTARPESDLAKIAAGTEVEILEVRGATVVVRAHHQSAA